MRRHVLLSFSALSILSLPLAAQERGETRVYRAPLVAARAFGAPRAMLGLTTSSSGGLRDTLGLLVTRVTEGGPAEKAGIEEGSRLQAINGVSLRAAREDAEDWASVNLLHRRLTRELEKAKPGDEVTLRVYAGGRTRDVRVKTADSEELAERRLGVAGERLRRSTEELRTRSEALRLRADSLRKAAEDRPTLGLSIGSTGSKRDTLGVFVMGVVEGGPADKAGIEEGSRIQSVDGVDLRVSPADVEEGLIGASRARRLSRAVGAKKPGDEVELRVYAAGQSRTVRLRLARAGDLPGYRGHTFIFGDAVAPAAPMAPMPPMTPRTPMAPRAPFHFEFDGGELGAELSRLGPMLREELEIIGPEIRFEVDRAMREAERGLGEGLSAGLEGLGRALSGVRVEVDAGAKALGRRTYSF